MDQPINGVRTDEDRIEAISRRAFQILFGAFAAAVTEEWWRDGSEDFMRTVRAVLEAEAAEDRENR